MITTTNPISSAALILDIRLAFRWTGIVGSKGGAQQQPWVQPIGPVAASQPSSSLGCIESVWRQRSLGTRSAREPPLADRQMGSTLLVVMGRSDSTAPSHSLLQLPN